MPFKLKLKKSRQYNVSSKNLFVLSVELLDNTTVECTLSSQSLGQECLNNVCQRLGLLQSQYFGLRFLSKKGTFWWVDLQRPLKRQLDKYALDSTNLYLGVMFFVSDVNILHDEVTRYHYFLQLKSDILEGKLHCNEDQTILFASYSLQAEFGDHDPERHTTEYLTNFGLLPKQMALPKENRESILERVILNHRSLQGMSQQLAEVYYIIEAQRLSGYGLECFAAKDPSGNAVIIGVSLMGIYIWYLNNQPAVYFSWDQILNLVHNKKCFGIEHRNNSKVLQIYLEDSSLAKYVWKTCIQQHSFYTKNEGIISTSSDQNESNPFNISVVAVNSKIITVNPDQKPAKPHHHMQESQESLDGLGIYHTDSGYSEMMPSTSSCNSHSNSNSKVDKIQSSSLSNLPAVSCSIPVTSEECKVPTSSLQPSYSQPLPQNFSSSQISLNNLRKVSLSDASINQSSLAQDMQQVEQKPICSVLPMYRLAPDYDTAIKLKYGIQSCSTHDMSTSHSTPQQPHIMPSNSQMVLSRIFQEPQINRVQSYSHYKNYTDLSHLDVNEITKNISAYDTSALVRNQEHMSAPTLHPPIHTYSSPDLASHSAANEISAEQLLNAPMMYQFKPPPPYPYKQRSSSSTPDLSCTHQVSRLPSSPDVILQKNLGINVSSHPMGFHVNPSFLIATSHPVCYQQKSVAESYRMQPYEPTSVSCAKIVTSNAIPHQTIASSQKVGSQTSLPVHTYQNYNPTVHMVDSCAQLSEPLQNKSLVPNPSFNSNLHSSFKTALPNSRIENTPARPAGVVNREDAHTMGPMLVAAMNGLSLSRPDVLSSQVEEKRIPNDTRIQALESRLAEGQVFLEFERVIKKKPNADFATAMLPENLPRNRFKDVFPYEENRVRLTPTSENKTGYINASHLSISLGSTQRFYIASQGPLPNTLYSFWQMVWEHHVSVIVMLTEVQEQGREKCFPYWPQEDGNKLQIGEFQIIRNFSMSSPTYVTCSLLLCHVTSHQQRSIWHIQYTDWPDHSCPDDTQGFIAFMNEVDAVRRHAMSNQNPGQSSSPIVVHCSAGVGRSGAVILCDIMLFCLDHNQPIDLPKVLTHLRLQRMLTVQTLAQYKFVYSVLIQYLKNSRLI